MLIHFPIYYMLMIKLVYIPVFGISATHMVGMDLLGLSQESGTSFLFSRQDKEWISIRRLHGLSIPSSYAIATYLNI